MPMDIVITAGNTSAAIDSLGAELISLKSTQTGEYIWQRDPAFWSGSAPVLFPIVGRLRDGKTRIEGKTYEMGGHGFAKLREFEVYPEGADQVDFVLRSSEKTLLHYPYRFELHMHFKVTEAGLTVRHTVINTDEKEILFGIGGHPAIRCPLEQGERFEDYELCFEHPETVCSPTFTKEAIICFTHMVDYLAGKDTLQLNYTLFDQDAVILEGLKSRHVTLRSVKSGRGIRFAFENFDTLAFWTPTKKQAPFICFEPWRSMGTRDDEPPEALEDKKGVVHLPAGETFTAQYSILFL